MQDKFKSRKLLITGTLFVSSTIFLFLDMATFQDWSGFNQWLFGIYAASNVGDKFSKKSDSETSN